VIKLIRQNMALLSVRTVIFESFTMAFELMGGLEMQWKQMG